MCLLRIALGGFSNLSKGPLFFLHFSSSDTGAIQSSCPRRLPVLEKSG